MESVLGVCGGVGGVWRGGVGGGQYMWMRMNANGCEWRGNNVITKMVSLRLSASRTLGGATLLSFAIPHTALACFCHPSELYVCSNQSLNDIHIDEYAWIHICKHTHASEMNTYIQTQTRICARMQISREEN